MKEVKATILASDMVGRFTEAKDCAITKAIQKAGLYAMHCGGNGIAHPVDCVQIGTVKFDGDQGQPLGYTVGHVVADMYNTNESRDINIIITLYEKN